MLRFNFLRTGYINKMYTQENVFSTKRPVCPKIVYSLTIMLTKRIRATTNIYTQNVYLQNMYRYSRKHIKKFAHRTYNERGVKKVHSGEFVMFYEHFQSAEVFYSFAIKFFSFSKWWGINFDYEKAIVPLPRLKCYIKTNLPYS
jgi:hypothetical protein